MRRVRVRVHARARTMPLRVNDEAAGDRSGRPPLLSR